MRNKKNKKQRQKKNKDKVPPTIVRVVKNYFDFNKSLTLVQQNHHLRKSLGIPQNHSINENIETIRKW